MVAPPNASDRRSTLTMEEVELHRIASAFSENEKQKQVKWFVSVGDELPSEELVREMQQRRQTEAAEKAKARRTSARQQIRVGHPEPFVVVPFDSHPMYRAGEAEPHFVDAAASGLDGRRQLHDTFSRLCRILHIRQRVSNRLSKVAAKHAGSDGTLKRGSVGAAGTSVRLITMPSALHSSSFTSRNVGDPPVSRSTVEFHQPMELKAPFEFKVKDYKRIPFPDHPFLCRDPEEQIPLYAAGEAEVPERVSAQSTREKPDVNDPPAGPAYDPRVHGECFLNEFTEPITSTEKYPMGDTALARMLPWSGLVEGSTLQRVCDGSITPALSFPDYVHALPSNAHASTAVHEALYLERLPDALRVPRKDDDLTDSDDEPFVTQHKSLRSMRQEAGVDVSELDTVHVDKPIHSFADAKKNERLASRRDQWSQWQDTLLNHVHPTLKKMY